ncbi:MAG: hypothetical protein PHW46_01045 [Candidatus Omnitrophica bacterium]|nr:hypothetical protein [Candidatus Omnitrophota bacterium]
MRNIIILVVALVSLLGCRNDVTGPKDPGSNKSKGIFWQFVKPQIELDPIEEEETPSVISPVKDDVKPKTLNSKP